MGSTTKKREIKFDLILFDVPSKVIPKSVYFTVFYDFLNERFNHVFENMVFSYRISFVASQNSNMYAYLYTNAVNEDNFRNASDGWLKYGDEDTHKIVDIIKCGTCSAQTRASLCYAGNPDMPTLSALNAEQAKRYTVFVK